MGLFFFFPFPLKGITNIHQSDVYFSETYLCSFFNLLEDLLAYFLFHLWQENKTGKTCTAKERVAMHGNPLPDCCILQKFQTHNTKTSVCVSLTSVYASS